MSKQHTQGKLKVVSTYAIPEIRDQEDHFVFAAGSASPQSFVDARRLVACWNACEGISTDLLENLTLTGDTIAARLKLRDATERELAAQRDELLEALTQTLAQCLIWQGEPNEWSCSIHKAVVEQARAAIAKAEGGET